MNRLGRRAARHRVTARWTPQLVGDLRLQGLTAAEVDAGLAELEAGGLIAVGRDAAGRPLEVDINLPNRPAHRAAYRHQETPSA